MLNDCDDEPPSTIKAGLQIVTVDELWKHTKVTNPGARSVLHCFIIFSVFFKILNVSVLLNGIFVGSKVWRL